MFKSKSYEECIGTKITLWSCFCTYKMESKENIKEKRSFRFLFGYVKKYRKYFRQIILGLIVGSLLQWQQVFG